MNFNKYQKPKQNQNNINISEIVREIVNYEELDFDKKFELLNKKADEFVNNSKLSKSKFRKYYDMFINVKEKVENNNDISKKREEYEKVLLKAYILAKYDINRKQLSYNSLDVLFENIIEKIKNENDEKFVKVFENLTLFLEAVAAYLKKD